MRNVYWIDDVHGFPLGGHAVIVARDRGHARKLFLEHCKKYDAEGKGNYIYREGSLFNKNKDVSLDAFEVLNAGDGFGVVEFWDGDY